MTLSNDGQNQVFYLGVCRYIVVYLLSHVPLVPHIMNWVSIGPVNGLSPVQHHTNTWTNAELWPIRLLETNFCEIQIKPQNFSFMNMHIKMLSVKWQPFWPGRDELFEES